MAGRLDADDRITAEETQLCLHERAVETHERSDAGASENVENSKSSITES
jgi:hypothetical protein